MSTFEKSQCSKKFGRCWRRHSWLFLKPGVEWRMTSPSPKDNDFGALVSWRLWGTARKGKPHPTKQTSLAETETLARTKAGPGTPMLSRDTKVLWGRYTLQGPGVTCIPWKCRFLEQGKTFLEGMWYSRQSYTISPLMGNLTILLVDSVTASGNLTHLVRTNGMFLCSLPLLPALLYLTHFYHWNQPAC